jgi:ComF family protein
MARAPLVYADQVKDMIRRYKFGRKRYLAQFFAEFVIDCYFEHNIHVDYVTYVPIHKTKLKSRGFNQSQLIAQQLSQTTNIPLLDTLCKRIQHDHDTAEQSRQQRFENLQGVMQINQNIVDKIKYKSILLIDDVFTTGATVGACTKVLKNAGVVEVYILTIASGRGFVSTRQKQPSL